MTSFFQRRGMLRRIAASLPLVCFGILAAWLVFPREASSNVLEYGERLPRPQLNVVRGDIPGSHRGRDIVVFFQPKCEPCGVQIGMLERSVTELGEARLYLLSAATPEEVRTYMRKWPRLSASDGVSWASIAGDQAYGLFGVKSTPTIIVFDNQRVASIRVGTATLASLLDQADSISDRFDRTARVRSDPSIRNRSAEKCGSCGVAPNPNGSRP